MKTEWQHDSQTAGCEFFLLAGERGNKSAYATLIYSGTSCRPLFPEMHNDSRNNQFCKIDNETVVFLESW